MKWRAWYADGSVYSSTDTSWVDLPAGGIVGVVVYLSETVTPYRQIVDGADWYWLEDGKFQSVTTHAEWGQFNPAPEVRCMACLKKTGALPDDEWAVVQREMWESTAEGLVDA